MSENGYSSNGEIILQTLHKLLKRVYLPLLESQKKKEVDIFSTIHVDFLSQLKKFVKQVDNTKLQILDGMNLEIPEIKDIDPVEAAQDDLYVEEIEKKMEEWTHQIRQLIEKTSSKRPPQKDKGPLAEIDFWRQRSASISALWDQLNDPKIKYLVKVLLNVDHSQVVDGFQSSLTDLTKVYVESNDNVKFLETLERHFKNIKRARKSLLPIVDTLPSMMRALGMVWTISRHYNSEKRMQPLMVLIANEIAQKVEDYISIESEETFEDLFNYPLKIIKKLEESKKVVEKWEKSYLAQRQKIIDKSHGISWEFDHAKLFTRTLLIRDRCNDLLKIARIIKKHKDFLGPKMELAAGNRRGVEEVLLKVKLLLEPFKKFKDTFSVKVKKKRWFVAMKMFNQHCMEVENQIISFVDDSFSKLNSTEGAFKLLKDIENARNRGELEESVTTSVDSSVHLKKIQVLDRFSKEVQDIQDIFDKEHLNPPKTKNLPPIAGAIYWAESLFQRIFKPLDTIDRIILDNEKGHRVKTLCHHVGRSLKDYQVHKFRQWRQNVEVKTKELLERNILVTESTIAEGRVNFSHDLLLIIQETKYLAKLISNMRREEEDIRKRKKKMREKSGSKESKNVGLVFWKKFDDVPGFAHNVTLQESKYHHYIEELKIMLSSYKNTLELLEKPEEYILRKSISDLERRLANGFNVLNWNSLGISGFITQCNSKIMVFQSIVKKLQKNSSILKRLIGEIKNAVIIIHPNDLKEKHYDLSELYENITKTQTRKVADLVKKYKTISQTLLKIGGDLISSNVMEGTKRLDLSSYYSYWEKRIYRALFHMCMKNMKLLEDFKKTPEIIDIRISLVRTEVIITPDRNELVSTMDKIAKNIVESTKEFIRWRPGSCKPISIENVKDELENKAGYIRKKCSFFADLWPTVVKSGKESVISTATTIHLGNALRLIAGQVSNTMSQVELCCEAYEEYSKYWKRSIEQAVKKFGEKGYDFWKFDAKIERIRKDIENIVMSREFTNRKFVRVCFTNMRKNLIKTMESWIQEYGKMLRVKTKPLLDKLENQFEEYQRKLSLDIENLDDLKNLLTTIQEIFENTVNIERLIYKVQSYYTTLQDNKIDIPANEIKNAVYGMDSIWKVLLLKTKRKKNSIGPLKEQFRKKTKVNVKIFFGKIKYFNQKIDEGLLSEEMTLENGLVKLEEIEKELKDFKKQRKYFVESEKLFEMAITTFPLLVEIEGSINKEGKAFRFYERFKVLQDRWSMTLFKLIQVDEMTKSTKEFLIKLNQEFTDEEKTLVTYKKVKEAIEQFFNSIPLFDNLKSEALKPRHWEAIMKKTGVKINVGSSDFTLQKLVEMGLFKFEEEMEQIFANAKGEARMEEMLRQISEKWRTNKFTLKEYVRGTKKLGHIIVDKDLIKQQLADDTMQLSNISGSHHIGFFEQELRRLEKALSTIDEVLDLWIEVQKLWINLEVIFVGSRDIREHLRDWATQFDRINDEWVKIMSTVGKNKNIKEAAKYPGRKELLRNLKDRLLNCQKGLSKYLQSKRDMFPRFYYLSDEQLLSILGSPDPKFVQLHVSKMYPNCRELMMKKITKTVVGMRSKEDEEFIFKDPVKGGFSVEVLLTETTNEMKSSLKAIAKESIFHYPRTERVKWIEKNLGMISLLGCQIWWTWDVEDAFNKVKKGDKTALKELSKKLTKQIEKLVEEIGKPHMKRQRKKFTTSIIIDVHARDIVDKLVRDSVFDKNDFLWESQLRFYWDRENDNCVINQCTGEFNYGYEYQGINGRLVITPLTDRCFMTLTQALSFHLGGSPAGPAGTGKTESVKDLAKSLGYLCVVFNCGIGLDNATMSRIFAGLCQNGSWGCFDEFNRIELSVLSVVSSQIRSIQDALKSKLSIFRFDDQDIKLQPEVGVFVTMNPGYAGRVELPNNLKELFRPCVMVVPDMEIICEILLFSEGFLQSRQLSRKMVKLYQLAEGQLSKQKHYDWGLRAIRSVLRKAGSLKVEFQNGDESKLIMKALYDMNIAKFIFDDRPFFEDLLRDLFVTVDIDKSSNEAFFNEIKKCLRERYYYLPDDNHEVNKVIQLCDTLESRHSTMIVGGTCGGKSVVVNTLAEAQTNLGYKTNLYYINPKAQTVIELYGIMNSDTKDWEDGLLSNIFREINTPTKNIHERRYIVFDGDVDSVWIESMNSVMDDNKLLTLPNSERITLLNQCKLLFEVGNLDYASPATVSRCGMVYVDPKNLGYKPVFYRWIKRKLTNVDEGVDEFEKVFKDFFERYAVKSIEFVLNGIQTDGKIGTPLKLIIPFTNVNMVSQLCTLCDSFMEDYLLMRKNVKQMETLFMFCVLWSIGSTIVEEEREVYDRFLKKISSFNPFHDDDDGDSHITVGSFPTSQTLYEYYFNTRTRSWENWRKIIPSFKAPEDRKFSNILVPTIDTVRYTYFLERIVSQNKPILFVGVPGTAKTVIINNFISRKVKENPNKATKLNLHFSSRTTSLDLQRAIEEQIEKRIGDIHGPKDNKKMYLFIDELSIPKKDIYGTQQPIEFLKFLFEQNGFYERKRKTTIEKIPMIKVKDVHYLCAMGPPGMATHEVNPRFISKFNVFNLTFPSDESIKKIYNSILNHHFSYFVFNESTQTYGEDITKSTLKLHKFVVKNLPPTPSKFHYVFNLRDLSRVYEGLCLSSRDNFSEGWKFVRLWRNECLRVYHDRLIDDKDRVIVMDKINSLAEDICPKAKQFIMTNPSLFGDFEDIDNRDSTYNDLGQYSNVRKLINKVIDYHNIRSDTPLFLVMFDDALEHLLRIYRIIRMDKGNALLVGVGGSGKKSLTRLAAYLADYEVFTVKLSRNYNELKFKDDLKELFKQLGVANKKTVFLFCDAHIVDECFLEHINSLLTSGMIHTLFNGEEKMEVLGEIQQAAKDAGFRTNEEKWGFFVDRCVNNLHVVLALSPGKKLRERCRNFPGIVNNTTIDWFKLWPVQALREVSENYLMEENLKDADGFSYLNEIVAQMVSIHTSVSKFSEEFYERYKRFNFVTPKNYISFIFTYLKLLKENRKKIDSNSDRLSGGLSQLAKAEDDVALLQKDLTKTKLEVEAKQKEVAKLQLEINEKQTETLKEQKKITKKEQELNVSSKNIQEKKEMAQKLLMKAEPILMQSEDALKELKKHKHECQEMKSYKDPHRFIKEVGSCITILFSPKGNVELNWKTSQRIMSSSSFISDLLNYNKKRINESKVRRIREIMAKNGKEFNSVEIKKKSVAASVMLTWIESICGYHDIFSEVKPLRTQLEKQSERLAKTQQEVLGIQEKLARLKRVRANLDIEKESAEKESEKLLKKSKQMTHKLKIANKLIDGLSSERERWTLLIDQYKKDKVKLLGDCLLAAGFLSYLGPFTIDYRDKMLHDTWCKETKLKKIPVSKDFSLRKILTDDVEISTWESQGLPSDEISVQNGILTLHAVRFPLCIDPQLQAVSWIKERLKEELIVKTFNEEFMKYLENSVRFGQNFLFEDVDEFIDPIIEPILDVEIQKKKRTITLGEEKIEVDKNFNLFLCTRLSNPYYSPEIQGKTSIINYGVTFDGLQEQLLSEVVKFESRSLENERINLVHQTSANKTLLKNFEGKILQELNISKDVSLIDNVELIEMLEETRKKVVETNKKLIELEKKNKDIKIQRETYRRVAKRGAILFFVMSSLSSMNSMYEYSLSSFMKDVFQQSLERSKKTLTMSIHDRLKSIIEHLTYNFYTYICNGLFEKDRLTFVMLMCIKVMEGEGQLTSDEVEFFIKGNLSLRIEQKQLIEWMSKSGWRDLLKLEREIKVFKNIIKNIKNNESEWKKWAESEAPEKTQYPTGYNNITSFQKLLLLRCFRVDRVIKGVNQFICNNPHFGSKFISTRADDKYLKIYRQSVNTTPIICMISPGYDPASAILNLADTIGQRCYTISLGQGVGERAKSMIVKGIQKGYWILLQNCHLLVSWLKEVEKILSKMNHIKVHAKFRLWMTSEVTKFPISILQKSLKIVTEPPRSLKLNMLSSYGSLTEEQLSKCMHPALKPLTFVLTYYHGILQERRKYGKIGWNISYDFNKADYLVSFSLMNTYLTKDEKKIPWNSLKYLIGESMYGGRCVDFWDRRVLITYLNEFMGDFLFDTFQPFHFYQNNKLEIDYCLPKDALMKREDYNKNVYVDWIQNTIKLENSPEVVGLHPNAEISYLTNSSRYLWDSLVLLESKKIAGSSDENSDSLEEKIKKRIHKVTTLVPKVFDLNNIKKSYRKKKISPIQAVLFQEIEKWNILIEIIKETLVRLDLALSGKIGMSNELEELGVNIANGIVPEIWKRYAPPTKKKLANWLDHLQKRFNQYNSWIETGKDPDVIWLSGLHIPESYLTAIVQMTCKRKKWPLDKVVLFTEVTKLLKASDVKEKPQDGCYVKGLFLEGASWSVENNKLEEQKPKVLNEELPLLKITPIEVKKLKLQNTYKTPVYTTTDRMNRGGRGLCFEANLASKVHESHWVLKGVALILNVD